MVKKQLGQFFTKNSDYILQGLEDFIKGKEVIDPFAGGQDLIMWAKKYGCKNVVGFDIDKKYIDKKIVFENDSLNNPKKYKFVLTNPPYLHKNKADKATKDKFFGGKLTQFEDLYQISIFSILNSDEGILIVPLNFISAENSQKIRQLFFNKFAIKRLNLFSEKVFGDTTYNVVSFYFYKWPSFIKKNTFPAFIFPEGRRFDFVLEKKFGWRLGGDFLNEIKQVKNRLGVSRLTEDCLDWGDEAVPIAVQSLKDKKNINVNHNLAKKLRKNILFLRAIDSKNGKKICLEDIRKYGITALVGKNTSRNLAHLIFNKELPLEEQENLMRLFNEELNKYREKYLSLFLTNFRDNNRKRISFNLTYKFLNYLYEQENQKQSSLF